MSQTKDRLDGVLEAMYAAEIREILGDPLLALRREACVPGPGTGAAAGKPASKLPPEAATTNVDEQQSLAVRNEKADDLAGAATATQLLLALRGSARDFAFAGFLRERMGDVKGAQEANEKALVMDPTLVGPRVGRVFCLLALRRGADALTALTKDPAPPQANLLWTVATVYAAAAAHKDDVAKAAMQTAIELAIGPDVAAPTVTAPPASPPGGAGGAPAAPPPGGAGGLPAAPVAPTTGTGGETCVSRRAGYRIIVETALHTHLYGVARAVLAAAAAKDATDAAVPALQLAVAMDSGDEATERALIGTALKAARPDPHMLFLAGVVEMRDERVDKALALWRQAAQAAPQDGRYALAIAQALDRKGSKDALAAYQKAAEIDPKAAEPHVAIALLKHLKGDNEGAEAELLAAIKREPNATETRYYLAIVEGDRMGLGGKALDVLREYKKLGGTNEAALSWLQALEDAVK